MRILVISFSHRSAPVELREKLAFDAGRAGEAIERFRATFPAAEVVLLCTCNRTEIYAVRPSHEPPAAEQVLGFLAQSCGLSPGELTAAALQREGEPAVGHLFRVAAGLESMVLGEPQVLGQVKRAYELARVRGGAGPVLHRLFQDAIAFAKQVRRETGIAAGRVSVASVGVDFARQIFAGFEDKTVVGIGAGEMAKITLRHLQRLRPARLWLANRSTERASALAAELGLRAPAGGVRPFADLDELLVEADIVMTSTAAPQPIITAERFRPLLKRRRSRPLYLIDLAVPRDVAPEVGSLTNVYLYNIDDLQQVVAQTHQERSGEVRKCEALLAEAARQSMAHVQHRDIGLVIRDLRQRLQEIGELEQERTRRKLVAAAPQELEPILQEHTHRVINKILHLPLSQLDRRKSDAPLGFYAHALRRLFQLEESGLIAPNDQPTPPEAPEAPAGEESKP